MYKFIKCVSKLPTYERYINQNRLINVCFSSSSRLASATEIQSPAVEKLNFDVLIKNRRNEASRSILVQVNSEKSYTELFRYCSSYGNIVSAHHYTQEDSHYILLEYSDREAAQSVIQSSTFNEETTSLVVQSPFLWFRAGPKPKTEAKQVSSTEDSTRPLSVLDGNRAVSENELNDALRCNHSLDAQMKMLHQTTRLNEIGTRLRFVAARQIEQAMHGMFPNACAYPFGSSVNGFGRQGCDLDLILKLSSDQKPADPNSRLVFHTKENLTNGRSHTQRQMESISDTLHLFLPGVCHVRRILQARVPIIKYHQDHLDLEVDLSMSNLTGVYMSEILYMFGNIDDRVMPLVFSIRRWAHSVGLTNASPGRWISNFSLTCLVIFYLQQLRHPILPSINTLIAQSRHPQDKRITEDGVNCTFLRDLNTLQFDSSQNTTELSQLLIDFFEFYSQMDFKDRAISLNEGRTVSKPDHAPIYIVNPLETLLNVSKNISSEECERFRIEVRNAAWALESFPTPKSSTEWGLLSIAKHPHFTQNVVRPSQFFKPRMVDVSALFGGEQEEGAPASTQRRPNVFKNDMIKNVVDKIQRKGRSDIQALSDQMNAAHPHPSSTNGNSKVGTLPARARKR